MKLVTKLFAVLVLSGGAYFAVVEKPIFANVGCSGNSCQIAQCQRRNCYSDCGSNLDCQDRCDQAFLAKPGVDYDCWKNRDALQSPNEY